MENLQALAGRMKTHQLPCVEYPPEATRLTRPTLAVEYLAAAIVWIT